MDLNKISIPCEKIVYQDKLIVVTIKSITGGYRTVVNESLSLTFVAFNRIDDKSVIAAFLGFSTFNVESNEQRDASGNVAYHSKIYSSGPGSSQIEIRNNKDYYFVIANLDEPEEVVKSLELFYYKDTSAL